MHPQSRNNGAIAQLVEQRTENPCVPGSIPGGTTKKIANSLIIKLLAIFLFVLFDEMSPHCHHIYFLVTTRNKVIITIFKIRERKYINAIKSYFSYTNETRQHNIMLPGKGSYLKRFIKKVIIPLILISISKVTFLTYDCDYSFFVVSV